MNYITALPDFIEMQRVSFCWFLAQGLTDELKNFSSVLDFSGNIEYLFFGQEYKLVKPIYNAASAKRYTANYVAQLIMPIEMRNKRTNTIMKQGRLPIANLPLMTTNATFIINGCERIIVSQVIRSPGIYFERNKKQRKRKINKLTLSNDFHKIRQFTQTSFGLIKNPNITYLLPILKQSNFKNHSFDFIEFFKIYAIISKTYTLEKKTQRIKNFLKLLNISTKIPNVDLRNSLEENNQILYEFNYFLKLIIKLLILMANFKHHEQMDKIIREKKLDLINYFTNSFDIITNRLNNNSLSSLITDIDNFVQKDSCDFLNYRNSRISLESSNFKLEKPTYNEDIMFIFNNNYKDLKYSLLINS